MGAARARGQQHDLNKVKVDLGVSLIELVYSQEVGTDTAQPDLGRQHHRGCAWGLASWLHERALKKSLSLLRLGMETLVFLWRVWKYLDSLLGALPGSQAMTRKP